MARSLQQIGQHLSYWTKAPPSAVGVRVARLLDDWAGLHNFDERQMKKCQWWNPLFIELVLSHQTTTGQLSTFDFDGLTRLVFLAHDHCIRVDVNPCNNAHFKLQFHPRRCREGDIAARHPTLEEAVERWRRSHVSLDPPAVMAVPLPKEPQPC